MKKSYLVFLILFAFSFNSHSQVTASEDYSYEVSEPYEVIDGRKFYFTHQDKMVSIKINRKTFYIQQFDTKTLKELKRKEYDIKSIFPKKFRSEGVIKIHDKIHYFYSPESGIKTHHEGLYYLTIDVNSAEIIGDAVKIVDSDEKLLGSFLSSASITKKSDPNVVYGDEFDFFKSQDSTKILIQYRKKLKEERNTESPDIIDVSVFNSDLSPIWNKEFTMPYTEKQMDLYDFSVDNEGNAYILSKVFNDDSNKDKKKKKDEMANYHIELFKLSPDENEITKTKIELDGIFINGISLFESGNNQLFCAGYYNKGLLENSLFGKYQNKDSAHGVVIIKVSKEGDLLETITHEIPLEVINMYVDKKAQEKNKKKDEDNEAELQNMELRDLIIYDDGSLAMVGEQYNSVWHYDAQNGMSTTVYHYNNILITKINADGSLAWMNKIPKRQVGTSSLGGMSYTYLSTSSDHYLLFLDNVKNMELAKDKYPHRHSNGKGGYFTSYKIHDASGEVTKSSVFDTRNLTDDFNAHQFSTDRVIKTSDSQFIVEVYKKGKEDVLVKVSIK